MWGLCLAGTITHVGAMPCWEHNTCGGYFLSDSKSVFCILLHLLQYWYSDDAIIANPELRGRRWQASLP